MKHTFKLGLQIFLLIASVFAFAYIIKDVEEGPVEVRIKTGSFILLILKLFIKLIFDEKSLVSAADVAPSDLQNGVATCPKGKDGSICSEYTASSCESKCAGTCFPAKREKVVACKLGTCFDPLIGTCSEGSPREKCEAAGGEWFENNAGNVPKCQKACCVVGSSPRPLRTERECQYIKETEGIETKFRTDLRNELACLALSYAKVEGACVFESGSEKSCLFTSKSECDSRKGGFMAGSLCTDPELNMNYKKQDTAKCVDDKLYWFDDYGNKENIYSSIRAESWNNGKVLSEDKSCQIGTSGEKLRNQKNCGNCDRLLGSVCGAKTSSEKLDDGSINFVCRDMRCKDKNGNIKQNGESWCEYQGDTGVEKGAGDFERSVDTPGSSHFRVSCIDGEVKANRCGDGYRNSICVEEKNKREDGTEISSSACITNLWQLCLAYNSEIKGEGEERTRSLEERDKKCNENPHCLLKKTDIANNFKFNLCVPRYSPGFDLQKNAEGGELSCQFASQKCTVVKVKEIGGWKVKVNKGCLEPKFAEQMNDLCMSLGDCGAEVNYIGELTENYNVYNSPKLNKDYLNEIKKYADVVKGKYIKAGNLTEYLNAIGGLELLSGQLSECGNTFGEASSWACVNGKDFQTAGMISGALGGLITMIGPSSIGAAIAGETAPTASTASSLAPAISAFSGAFAGAAIGFAVTSLLIKYTGIGAGLDPAVTWALIGAGVVGGAMIGFTIATQGLAAAFSAAVVPVVGWIIVAVVIIIIIIFTALGIGKTKKINVEFQCKPWQPPLGGKGCDKCGSDGYACSKYSCQALGQTCRLVNEGTQEEKCVDISPNDVKAPVIKPWKDVLSPGFEYKEESVRGVKIASNENDECLRSYQPLFFGIKLDEVGYCRFNTAHTTNFDEMQNENGGDFGGRNLFIENHTHYIQIPDLTSFGIENYDITKRADFALYVRCIDGNGNGKDSAEYAINMCIKPGEDKTSPVITGREPYKEFVSFNETKLRGSVFTYEPADCRWDLAQNKKYAEMKNEMSCENDIVDRNSLFRWRCSAEFPIDKEENTFYIQCLDQPWYGEGWQGEGNDTIKANESKRNEMGEAYPFVVKRTKTELKIDSIEPDNKTFKFGVVPATVILEVKTTGGVDGTATCYLKEIKPGNEMGETFGSTHKQVFNEIMSGEYKFNAICRDSAGNTASASAQFKVELDVTPPIITRIYGQGTNLIVITNEAGECAFVKGNAEEACNFDFEKNGTLMSGNELSHSTSLDKDATYYIKCKDGFNTDGACSAIVRGGEFVPSESEARKV